MVLSPIRERAILPPPLTLGICTNRLDRVDICCKANLGLLEPNDHCVIVLDAAPSPKTHFILKQWGCIAKVLVNDCNRGLSYSRNLIVSESPTSHVLFIDDDILLNTEVITGFREAFAAGNQVVGVQIQAPPAVRLPWYMTAGQLHYLGVHGGPGPHRTWGACMGFDVSFVRAHQLTFRQALGRFGGQLASGEDTTFVGEMKRLGAREAFLNELRVTHDFEPNRLNANYLARRAYWQGRSEVRRRGIRTGITKEWRRFTGHHVEGVLKYPLAVAYMGAFGLGVFREFLFGGRAARAQTN
jgi:hypothetical protein